jgi:hypothetical protein
VIALNRRIDPYVETGGPGISAKAHVLSEEAPVIGDSKPEGFADSPSRGRVCHHRLIAHNVLYHFAGHANTAEPDAIYLEQSVFVQLPLISVRMDVELDNLVTHDAWDADDIDLGSKRQKPENVLRPPFRTCVT